MPTKNGQKKNITLAHLAQKMDKGFDQMAGMVARGFERTYEDIGKTKQSVEGKIDQLDERLRVIETKLDRALYTEITHIEARLRRVEHKIGLKAE